MEADWFPHSPIQHFAFSSWIEKTMTKTIHCIGKTDLFYNSIGLCGNFIRLISYCYPKPNLTDPLTVSVMLFVIEYQTSVNIGLDFKMIWSPAFSCLISLISLYSVWLPIQRGDTTWCNSRQVEKLETVNFFLQLYVLY